MHAAREQEPLITKPALKEAEARGWRIIKPTSEEEIHGQTAQKVAEHSTEAGIPTTIEQVKGGTVVTITPEMRNLGIKPSGSDLSVKDVIRVATEDLVGKSEGTHRAGEGESGHGLYSVIDRIKGKMRSKKEKLQKAA